MSLFRPGMAFACLFGVSALLGLTQSADAERAYIGTYTPAASGATSDNHGQGIYLVDIDPTTGIPSNPRLVAKTPSPSWIALSADHKFLYATNEVANYGPEKSGSVSAFAVDPTTGALRLLNVVSSEGAVPAYISIHPSGKYVLIANYTGGSYAVIRLNADGSLGQVTDVVRPAGPLDPPTASDNPPGQFAVSDHRGSRGHMIGPDRGGQFVIGDDAGRDQIFVWRLDTNTGKLIQVSRTASLPGSAPRHFVFSHDDTHMYQLQEQDSRLAAYAFHNGALSSLGPTASALPDGYAGSNTASELLIAPDGRHLYFANRTHDSIATFSILPSGTVRRISDVPTEGDTPRSLTLDPSGKFLYSLNQRADNVTTFSIGSNGIPRFTGNYLPLGSPAVMVFLP